MEDESIDIEIYFSAKVEYVHLPPTETEEFYAAIRHESEKYFSAFQQQHPGLYPALKQALFSNFEKLAPHKIEGYQIEDLNNLSTLQTVVIMIYERLLKINLKHSINQFMADHQAIPVIGQVFTPLRYEREFQSILRAFPATDKYSHNTMEWILQDYNFILVSINYTDADDVGPSEQKGELKFYFYLNEAF